MSHVPITIQAGHVNYRGHLARVSIVRILDEARAKPDRINVNEGA